MGSADGVELLQIVAGRRLEEAPRWPEADEALFFDQVSGDFWVLAADAAAIVRQAMQQQLLSAETSATVASLIGAGLLEHGRP